MTWYLLDIVGKQKTKDDELKMSEKSQLNTEFRACQRQ